MLCALAFGFAPNADLSTLNLPTLTLPTLNFPC